MATDLVTNRGSIMVLWGVFRTACWFWKARVHLRDGTSVMQRITWKAQDKGVRESAVLSKDGGQKWTPAFDGAVPEALRRARMMRMSCLHVRGPPIAVVQAALRREYLRELRRFAPRQFESALACSVSNEQGSSMRARSTIGHQSKLFTDACAIRRNNSDDYRPRF